MANNDLAIQALTQLKLIEQGTFNIHEIKAVLKQIAAPEKKVSDLRIQFRAYELNRCIKKK